MALIDFVLTQEAIVTPWLREAEGEDIYGEPETRKCRIQHGDHLRHTYVNPNGAFDQVEARAKLFCTGDPIPTRSIVECEGERFIVLDCYIAHGFQASHLEVTLQ